MSEIHPGAALFSEEARKAVAEGPLFDHRSDDDFMVRRVDFCCVVMALGTFSNPDYNPDSPSQEPHLRDLMARNDRGDYADPIKGRANLRRDLLGVQE